ncbi:Bug family tripartite tricarboxylate transporter substrate binding protein [Pollutimonas bauzanensis]|uniref:Tripartite-type tricarboxylate transporter, receptor component TctC n=1 Tax=Pollutimonas bauzanensis TaxID=658167 RepID=A0A1M5YP40_9BURK|nr:tripartite tricarboxylate transporter substrate binding protein [Pollutimonas bauzanensis]SHI13681.1 Tripartite-type tricarboxylate transporter, receptor component TctC [Pollutimonas bauzanensis]
MKNLFKHLIGGAVLLASSIASAAPFPDRPIELIIPYPPGGTADAVGRPLAAGMQKRLGVPVVVQYKGGASGAIATQYVARAAPNGYTVIMVLAAHAINPSLYPNLPYDAVKDFTPISMVAKLPLVLYTNPKFGPKTIPEFIRYAKDHPGDLSVGSAGNGNTSHLALELFSNMAGVKLMHVPYKGGGPSIIAAMGGEVDAVFAGPDSLHLAQAGKLHVMAVTSPKRLALTADTPTIQESGLKDYEVQGWYGLLAPAGTPDDAVAVLNKAVADTLADPQFTQVVEGLGYIPSPSSPVGFMDYIKQEMARWAQVVKKANIKIE